MTTKTQLRERFFSSVSQDLVGGLTAAIVALPIALAFGVASGLGPSAGLYGAIAGGFFAAMLGGTATQVTGPTGPMTVVVAALYATNRDRPEVVFAAVIIAGVLQMLLGKIKAGQLIEYMPYPVVSGFMTGIGLIIIILQVNPLLGKAPLGKVADALIAVPEALRAFNLQALSLGVATILLLFLLPKVSKKLPKELVTLVGTTLFAVSFMPQIPVISEIPQRIPIPSIPMLEFHEVQQAFIAGIALAILGSLDSLLTSLVVDKTTMTRHDSNEELTGQGVGNIAAGFIGGLPGAGATMRTIVNIHSGGRSRLSGMIHSLVLLLVVALLGSMASRIPLTVLSGILIVVGISIIDYRSLSQIRQTPKSDVIVMLTVLFLTVFVDLIIAVLVGVCLACALFVKEVSDAQLSEHGNIETLEHLVEVAEHLSVETRKAIYTYTFNGPLFFGEVKNFQAAMQSLEGARYITLRFTNMPIVDQSGALALEEAERILEAKGAQILFVGIRPDIQRKLEEMKVIRSGHSCFRTLEEAVQFIYSIETSRSR
ncbi:MAG TPA: SulP family inorganic anion transporter [Candidatus Melainabacteria bacterium]|nr:SulP family inorganic anion transporter [Candidatus Melainabacteria bacterium]